MPSFRAIRAAILNAPAPPQGFPLAALHDQESLRAIRAASHFQPFLAQMRAEAERARATPIPPLPFSLFRLFELSGDRLAFQAPYFDRRRRLLGLALAAAIDGDDAALPALGDLIWAMCDEYSWALPAHLPVGVAAAQAAHVPPAQVVDLFAAHTAHALAEAITLLGERLDPWLHYRVRAEVERRIFLPLFHDPHHFRWESAPMNWSAVCAGCAGMTALALVDDRERLAGMIDRCVRAMECFLEGFGDDGGCPEGIGYWEYGFGFYTYFAEALREYTGGAIDLLQGEQMRRIAAFPQAVTLGGDRWVNYSDADARTTIHPGLGARLAARLGQPVPGQRRPDFHKDHAYRWGHLTRDLLWTEASALDRAAGDGSFYLPELAWAIDRRLVDGAMLAFSAKGGHNGEPHNHNDLGHFILHVGGESLLADLGAGVYTRQYFGPQRYESLHTGSHGHSLPLINGQAQAAGPEYAAALRGYSARPDGLDFALDLTRAYPEPGLESFVRDFAWAVDPAARAATLRLTDSFRFAAPATVEECFISLRAPALAEGAATWAGERGSVTLRYDGAQFEPEVEQIVTRAHQGDPLSVYRLRLRARERESRREDGFVFVCRL